MAAIFLHIVYEHGANNPESPKKKKKKKVLCVYMLCVLPVLHTVVLVFW